MRKGYDPAEDNLIIVDATGERYFTHAADELANYGCRYARMVILAQEAFRGANDKEVLYQYPNAHLVELPARIGKHNESIPWSQFLLPHAMSLLGVGMACAFAENRDPLPQPTGS